MNLKFKSVLIMCFSLFVAAQVAAGNAELEQARKQITARLQSIEPGNIEATPIKGLYMVSVPPRLFYVSGDGKFAIDGDMIDIEKNINVTEQLRSEARLNAINALGEDSMIIFSPEKVKHTITVFTDIDCGYCRKLHNDMAGYNKQGIRVRYLAFPRAGVGSPSYNKAVSVWCAKDRKEAMTNAKNDQAVPSKECDNPVADHYNMGNMVGVRGTPALVLDDGQLLPGYVPPARLAAMLEQHQKQASK